MERLGLAYMRLKRWPEAFAAFDGLKIYKPYNYIGETLLELAKPDEAAEAFSTAVNYNPDPEKARYNLGRTYLKLGKTDMAKAQYEILKAARSDWADKLLVLIEP